MKNPTILSLTPARILQMSTLCDLYLQKRSTERPRVLWKICGEVSSVEAKDSSEGNYQGKGKGPTTGRLHEETRFHKSGIFGGTRERFNSEGQPVGLSSDKGAVQATSEGGNVTDVTFVDDCIVDVAVARVRTYAEEYDTNSENDFSDGEDEDITPITVSGRPIRAHFRFLMYAYCRYL